MFNERAELLDVYRATPQTLRALLRGLPDEVVRAAGPDEDPWSIVEIVCHLRDAEERVIERVRRMRDEERPALAAYDQAALAQARRYRDQSLTQALEAFCRLREEQIALLEALAPEEWQRAGVHAEVGEITIQQLVAHMAAHDAVHLAQIARCILRHEVHALQRLPAS
ncbi:MAG: DinB family protein [Sphaerobacter sp.]|nr:DinB family protein [Sphaerobacter sp.]